MPVSKKRKKASTKKGPTPKRSPGMSLRDLRALKDAIDELEKREAELLAEQEQDNA